MARGVARIIAPDRVMVTLRVAFRGVVANQRYDAARLRGAFRVWTFSTFAMVCEHDPPPKTTEWRYGSASKWDPATFTEGYGWYGQLDMGMAVIAKPFSIDILAT